MRTMDHEDAELLKRMYEKAKIKIFIKDKGPLLANAQALIAGIQEINGITIWTSKFEGLNIEPPTYDPFHKCKAVWINDKKIWADLCKRIEREYLNKKDEQELEERIEDIEF